MNIFKAIITSCKRGVSDDLVQNGSTIRNWVEEEYLWAMTQIEQVLASSFSTIHVSFDSVDNIRWNCVLWHCGDISRAKDTVSVLLGLKRMKAGPTGEVIAGGDRPCS